MSILEMEPIQLYLGRKWRRIMESDKKFIVLIGGRGSGKSEGAVRVLLAKASTEGCAVLCCREFYTSISDSVHKNIKEVAEKAGMYWVDVTEQKIRLIDENGNVFGEFVFKGLARHSSAIRSFTNIKYLFVDEAQTLSQASIQDIFPTIRAPGSQIYLVGNPMSSGDPFSQRFIVPYQKELERDGFYEDDLHLIVVLNYTENPWHGELESQRLWSLEHDPRALYDHIWMGAFNDSVDASIIPAEWFDAAKDLHIEKGFDPRGMKVVSHDPADEGGDAKGLVYRHGAVILDVLEKTDGDVADACDWATGYANRVQANIFNYDADGLGGGLRGQIAPAFEGKQIIVKQFKGSQSPENPDEVYQPDEILERIEAKTNKETFLNKRSQFYIRLRDRFFKSYLWRVKGQYQDPNECISISSKINCMQQLRSEVCRIPLKPNPSGFIQIMSKQDMLTKHKIQSPNLADSLMMSMEIPIPIKPVTTVHSIPDRVYATANKGIRQY